MIHTFNAKLGYFMKATHLQSYLLVLILFASLSCDEKSVEQATDEQKVEIDSTRAAIVNVSGKLFSIPSPVQTALLVRNSEGQYFNDSLNSPRNYSDYSTNDLKAINLGIYGTEMAYASLYGDGQRSLQYFKAIENLSGELGIKAALNPELVKRLGANANNPDSLLILSGRFYEEVDNYLKANERFDIAALVLLGGWIEANYLTSLSALKGNEAAKQRIAQQQRAAKTLQEVLNTTVGPPFTEGSVMTALDSLSQDFSGIAYSYTFVEPTTDTTRKQTTIRSKSSFDITDDELRSIADRLVFIRNEIIQQ
jgi:hypothetical protein